MLRFQSSFNALFYCLKYASPMKSSYTVQCNDKHDLLIDDKSTGNIKTKKDRDQI